MITAIIGSTGYQKIIQKVSKLGPQLRELVSEFGCALNKFSLGFLPASHRVHARRLFVFAARDFESCDQAVKSSVGQNVIFGAAERLNDFPLQSIVSDEAQLRNKRIKNREWLITQCSQVAVWLVARSILKQDAGFHPIKDSGFHLITEAPQYSNRRRPISSLVSTPLLLGLLPRYPDRSEYGCDRSYGLNPRSPFGCTQAAVYALLNEYKAGHKRKQGVSPPSDVESSKKGCHFGSLS